MVANYEFVHNFKNYLGVFPHKKIPEGGFTRSQVQLSISLLLHLERDFLHPSRGALVDGR